MVDARVGEVEYAHQQERNEQAILDMAEHQYPNLKDPEIVEEVDARLAAMSQRIGYNVRLDPDFVEQAYLATEARRAGVGGQAAEEQPAEQQQPSVSLETGAGPSAAGPGNAPEPVDPQEAAWQKALGGGPKTGGKYGF
jgi:hypothetical protein